MYPTRELGRSSVVCLMAASDLTVFISSQELQHDEQVKKSHSRKEENPWEAREDLTCLLKSSPFCSFPTTKQREKHLHFNDSQHWWELCRTWNTQNQKIGPGRARRGGGRCKMKGEGFCSIYWCQPLLRVMKAFLAKGEGNL